MDLHNIELNKYITLYIYILILKYINKFHMNDILDIVYSLYYNN